MTGGLPIGLGHSLANVRPFKLTSLLFALMAWNSIIINFICQVNKDDSVDNYIKAILEELRAAMPTGIPELGIPILDPFDVPHFDIPHIE